MKTSDKYQGVPGRQQGFTLTELLIVVAIIGVLSAIAVPKYQDYVGRAQAAEAFTATAGLRMALTAYYAEEGTFSGAFADPLIKSSAYSSDGRYLESHVVTRDLKEDAEGVEFMVTFDDGVHKDKTLLIQASAADGANLRWTCGEGGTLEEKYLPAACRDA